MGVQAGGGSRLLVGATLCSAEERYGSWCGGVTRPINRLPKEASVALGRILRGVTARAERNAASLGARNERTTRAAALSARQRRSWEPHACCCRPPSALYAPPLAPARVSCPVRPQRPVAEPPPCLTRFVDLRASSPVSGREPAQALG